MIVPSVALALIFRLTLQSQTADATRSADCRAAPADATITVAVLDLRARGVDGRIAGALMDAVAEEVARAPRHKVLSRKDIEAMLTEESRRQLLGCDETSCLSELAGALNASLIVAGEVARVGASVVLTLQLINERYATVVNRVSLSWPGATEALPDVARAGSQLLVLERTQRPPGAVVVRNTPPNARVFVDGKPARDGLASELEVGIHSVRVEAPGFDDRTIPVIVRSGVQTDVDGTLSGIPVYRRWWFWTGGLVGAGLASTLAVVALAIVPTTGVLALTAGGRVSVNANAPPTSRRR